MRIARYKLNKWQKIGIVSITLMLIAGSLKGAQTSDVNVAYQKKVYVGKDYRITGALTDGSLGTAEYLQDGPDSDFFIVDLGRFYYIDHVVFHYVADALPVYGDSFSVRYSSDFINWKEVERSQTQASRWSLKLTCKDTATRFVMFLINSEAVRSLKELEVYPDLEEKLEITDTRVKEVQNDSAVISCTTNKLTHIQVLYEEEETFMFYSRLSSVALDVEAAKNHAVLVSGLKPDTGYRYQIVVTDLNGKQQKSSILGFTTR